MRRARALTLHRRFRARRCQKPHRAHHEVLKRLIARLAPLAHVLAKTGYLGRRVLIGVPEGRLEGGRGVVFAGCALDGVGFVAPLRGCEGAGEGWERTAWDGAQHAAAARC